MGSKPLLNYLTRYDAFYAMNPSLGGFQLSELSFVEIDAHCGERTHTMTKHRSQRDVDYCKAQALRASCNKQTKFNVCKHEIEAQRLND